MGRSIGTSIPEMFRSVDLNGIIIDCNHTYVERLGYEFEEVIGKSFLDHTPEKYRDSLLANFDEWKKTEAHSAGHIFLMTKSGEEFEVMLAASSLYDDARNLIGRNSTMREIAHLEEMAKMYDVSSREGYEHPEILHRSVNYKGIIIDCNKTYVEKLGYTKEEVIGVNLLEHTAPRSRGNISAHMENWRNGIHDTAKIWMLRKDKSEFLVTLTATDERDEDGALVGRTVALRPTKE